MLCPRPPPPQGAHVTHGHTRRLDQNSFLSAVNPFRKPRPAKEEERGSEETFLWNCHFMDHERTGKGEYRFPTVVHAFTKQAYILRMTFWPLGGEFGSFSSFFHDDPQHTLTHPNEPYRVEISHACMYHNYCLTNNQNRRFAVGWAPNTNNSSKNDSPSSLQPLTGPAEMCVRSPKSKVREKKKKKGRVRYTSVRVAPNSGTLGITVSYLACTRKK